jgi:hypothetical protein
VRNVFVLHLAEHPKQLPRSGTIAALTIYVSHDLLLPLNVTATDSDVSLGFIKGRQLHRGVHALLRRHMTKNESGISFQSKSTKVNLNSVVYPLGTHLPRF